MRRLLGALLLVTLLLAGCSDSSDDSGRADDPAPSSPSSSEPGETGEPSETGAPEDGWELVEIVHATAVDGETSTSPTPVGDADAVAAFSSQFSPPGMQEEILRVVEANQPAPGFELVASVIAIGCDVPPGVNYVDGEVRPLKVTDPHLECFAPVTSVAILVVEA